MSLESIGLLAEQERLRAQASGDLRPSSVPLFGLAMLVAGAVLFQDRAPYLGRPLYWLVATPLMFLGTWWWQRRSSMRTGQARPRRGYLIGAGAVLPLFVLVFPTLYLFPVAAPCAVLLILGIRRRNWYLAGWSAAIGFLGALVQLGFFDNRLYELNWWLHDYQPEGGGYFQGANTLSYVSLLALILGVASYALHREQR